MSALLLLHAWLSLPIITPAAEPPKLTVTTRPGSGTSVFREGGKQPILVAVAKDEPGKRPAEGPRLRLYHADGTILSGTLVEREIRIDTPLGELAIAADKIRSLSPTIARRARRAKRIAELIRDLAAAKFSDREWAQRQLAEMGADARRLLEASAADADAERRTRVKTLLDRIGPRGRDVDETKDTIEAAGNVVLRGRLLSKRISLRTPYGEVSADLADVDFLGPAEAGDPVNLLTVADPTRDSIGPRWTLDDQKKTLTSAKAKFARIQVPLDVPTAYEVELNVTPKIGRSVRGKFIADTLMVAIVVDGHPCQVALNSFTAVGKGALSGLDQIGGKRPPDYDSHVGEVLTLGRASIVRCRVQPGRVQVDCDAKRIIDWRGDSAVLSTHPAWLLRRPKSLGLGSFETTYEITRFVLTPLHRVPLLPNLADNDRLLQLPDGQRIVGKPRQWPTLTVAGSDPPRRFALAEVITARITDKGTKLTATLRDGSTVIAATPQDALPIDRGPITFTVPLADIQQIAAPPNSGM